MVELTFEVITPVLLRRGNIPTPIENNTVYYSDLSGQTFRGLLRWWFRFFMIPHVNTRNDLLKLENLIFGSSSERASPIGIHVNFDVDSLTEWSQIANSGTVSPYFAGFRYNPHRKRFKCLPPGSRITVTIFQNYPFSNSSNERELGKDLEKIYETLLEAISFFGGVGGGWRRGMGSIQFRKYNEVHNGKLWDILEELERELVEETQKVANIAGVQVVPGRVPIPQGIYFPNVSDVAKVKVINSGIRANNPLQWLGALTYHRNGYLRNIRRRLNQAGSRNLGVELAKVVIGYPARKAIRINRNIKRVPSCLLLTVKKDERGRYFGIALYVEYILKNLQAARHLFRNISQNDLDNAKNLLDRII